MPGGLCVELLPLEDARLHTSPPADGAAGQRHDSFDVLRLVFRELLHDSFDSFDVLRLSFAAGRNPKGSGGRAAEVEPEAGAAAEDLGLELLRCHIVRRGTSRRRGMSCPATPTWGFAASTPKLPSRAFNDVRAMSNTCRARGGRNAQMAPARNCC